MVVEADVVFAVLDSLFGDVELAGTDWVELLDKRKLCLYGVYRCKWAEVFAGVGLLPCI